MNPMSNPVPDRMLGDRRRVVVEHVRPTVDGGEFPAKATRGLPIRVSARAFADGHDPLLAWVWHWPGARPLDARRPALRDGRGADGSRAAGLYVAWIKPRRARRLELRRGRDPRRLGRLGSRPDHPVPGGRRRRARSRRRRRPRQPPGRICRSSPSPTAARSPPSPPSSAAATAARDQGRAGDPRSNHGADATHRRPQPRHDRRAVRRCGSSARWPATRRGTRCSPGRRVRCRPGAARFKLAQRRLPAIAAMGFSVLYLPPIHPIGTTHRKGPNNVDRVLARRTRGVRGRSDAASGGHTAVNPDTRAPSTTSTSSLRRRRRVGPRGGARLRPAVQPRSSLGDRASRSGSGTARTDRSATRRIRQSSTRTSTHSTSTATTRPGSGSRSAT